MPLAYLYVNINGNMLYCQCFSENILVLDNLLHKHTILLTISNNKIMILFSQSHVTPACMTRTSALSLFSLFHMLPNL